jgi:hypothetical protein
VGRHRDKCFRFVCWAEIDAPINNSYVSGLKDLTPMNTAEIALLSNKYKLVPPPKAKNVNNQAVA